MNFHGMMKRTSKLATISSNNSNAADSKDDSLPYPKALMVESTAAPLPNNRKYIEVQLLNRDHLYLSIDVKCTAIEVLECVCSRLELSNRNLFGLALFVEKEYRFVDLSDRVNKCLGIPKNWIKLPGWGTDLLGNPIIVFHLRVHTFVDCIEIIKCPASLLHYYLQLRENVCMQWEPSWIREERCFEAVAYALQSDYGDYDEDAIVMRPNPTARSRTPSHYFSPSSYFPDWVVQKRGCAFLRRHAPKMHADLRGVSRNAARAQFCREVTRGPWAVNVHLYGMRRRRSDRLDNAFLGLTPRGLEFFDKKESGERDHLRSFVWSKIGKVAFDRRKFSICSVDNCKKLTLFTSNDEKSRYLLFFCRSVHQNLMSMQQELLEARKVEFQESKQFRESYIYSDNHDFELAHNRGHLLFDFNDYSNAGWTPQGLAGGQRISLVSDASSNTTSGIVSDRQQNHDDSENENDYDIDFDATEATTIAAPASGSALRSSCDILISPKRASIPPDKHDPSSATVVCVGDGENLAVLDKYPNITQGGSGSNINIENSRVYSLTDAFDEFATQLDADSAQSSQRHTSNRAANYPNSIVINGTASDTTITKTSEDGQSILSASTTEKLDDCTDADSVTAPEFKKMSAVLTEAQLNAQVSPDPLAHSSEGDKMNTSLNGESLENRAYEIWDDGFGASGVRQINAAGADLKARPNISIAELRQQTLKGFSLQKTLPHEPTVHDFATDQSDSTGASVRPELHQFRSLATQTSGSYLSCYAKTNFLGSMPETEGNLLKYTLLSSRRPSTSVVMINVDSDKESRSPPSANVRCDVNACRRDSRDQVEPESRAYRIVACSSSVDDTHNFCPTPDHRVETQRENFFRCGTSEKHASLECVSCSDRNRFRLANEQSPASELNAANSARSSLATKNDNKDVADQWQPTKDQTPAQCSDVTRQKQYEQRWTVSGAKRWPTISGVDERDLAAVGGVESLTVNLVSQAQSEPRLSDCRDNLLTGSNACHRIYRDIGSNKAAYYQTAYYYADNYDQICCGGWGASSMIEEFRPSAADAIDSHRVQRYRDAITRRAENIGARRHSACCVAATSAPIDGRAAILNRRVLESALPPSLRDFVAYPPSSREDVASTDDSTDGIDRNYSDDVIGRNYPHDVIDFAGKKVFYDNRDHRDSDLTNRIRSSRDVARAQSLLYERRPPVFSATMRANDGSGDRDGRCGDAADDDHGSPLDWNELKHIVSSRVDIDLPMIRALCDDRSLQDVRCCRKDRNTIRPPERALAPRSSHPILPTAAESRVAHSLPQQFDSQPQLLGNRRLLGPVASATRRRFDDDDAGRWRINDKPRGACMCNGDSRASPNRAPSVVATAARFASTPNLHELRLPPPPPYYYCGAKRELYGSFGQFYYNDCLDDRDVSSGRSDSNVKTTIDARR